MTRQADATKRDTLTLEEAARRLGVSLRTVQRRIKDGDLSTIESDGARLVCLASGATEAATPARQNATRGATARQIDATKRDSEPDARADLLDHLRTENEYLKAQVDAWRLQTEAANRTANEAMASLRKALDAAPKAITGGDSGSTPTVARDVATGCDESGQPANHKGKAANVPQRTPQREMRPLWKVILGIR